MPTDTTAAIPFIRLAGASLTSTDTAAFGAVVDTCLPLQVHRWDHPQQDAAFLNHSGSLRLGDLTLLSTWGSAIDGEVEQKSEAQLVLPYLAGTNTFQIGAHRFSFRRSCLFIPAARTRIRLHCTTCSGVIFSFPRKPCCRSPMPSAGWVSMGWPCRGLSSNPRSSIAAVIPAAIAASSC